MRHYSLAALVVCATLSLQGCDGREATTPAELLPGVKSHSSIKEARQQVAKTSDGWRVVEDTKTPPDDKRPPFHLVKVAIDGYSDLNELGSLQLQFFNDRLMSATFYPKDIKNYVAKLKEKRGIVVALSQKAGNHGGASVHHAIDHRGQPYVAYVDKALEHELSSWIQKYS